MKKYFLSLVVIVLVFSTFFSVQAEESKEPIKIGYINAHTGGFWFTTPSGNGMKLAIEEINANGGVLGRSLALLSRDSKMNPAEAVRVAEELYTRDKAKIILNADSSSSSAAVNLWAKKNKVPFVVTTSGADVLVWEDNHSYFARTNVGTYVWISGLFEKAIEVYGNKLKNKRWVSIASTDEFGRSLVQAAKRVAVQRGLKADWVGGQWPVYGKMSAGPTISALERLDPEVVYVGLSGPNLAKFVREAKKRHFIKDRIFLAPVLGFPTQLQIIGVQTPEGWITTGYPFDEIKKQKPALASFMKKYEDVYHEPIKGYSVFGYNAVKLIAAAIEKAGSTDAEKIKEAFGGLTFDTPFGREHLRKIDHQAATFFWVGQSAVVNGKAKLVNWTEMKVNDHSLPDGEVLKLREDKRR